jgi:hypothetical protein
MLAAALVFALMTPVPAAANVESVRLHVAVRTERPASLDRRVLESAAREVRNVWRPYADVDLLICSPADCAASPTSGADVDLELVVVDRPLQPIAGGTLGLGEIVFVSPDRPEDRITVSIAAVRALVAKATLGGRTLADLPPRVADPFVARALGRAIAHEIGHYLLRSKAHASQGLMRSEFSLKELMEERLAPYRLEAGQIDRLRRESPLRVRRGPETGAVRPSGAG